MTRRFNVPRSSYFTGIEWLSKRLPYAGKVNNEEVRGDTYPLTWADDDEIYTSAGDPCWGRSLWGLDIEKISGLAPKHAVTQVNPLPDWTGWGGAGVKPTGMLAANGKLYLAYQNIKGFKLPVYGTKSQHGSDAVIACSGDQGLTWKPDVIAFGQFSEATFPGHRFGGPSFIQYGKGDANIRDGFVYAVSTDQWDNGGHLILGRVPADRITEGAAWQWVHHIDAENRPEWTGSLEKAVAVLSDDRWISLPEMVYLEKQKRYLLLTWHLFEDFTPTTGSSLVIYEAPEPWGPFSLVHHEPVWEAMEVNPYCPRVPLKWMEADGLTGWLLFSGSWEAEKKYYRVNVRKFRLQRKAAGR
jgi:hypothetical protein